MQKITKAQQLLQSTGFDIWGTGDKELGQILSAMQKAMEEGYHSASDKEELIKEWFEDLSITVDDDDN